MKPYFLTAPPPWWKRLKQKYFPPMCSIRLSDGRLYYMTRSYAFLCAREARARKMSLWLFLELDGKVGL